MHSAQTLGAAVGWSGTVVLAAAGTPDCAKTLGVGDRQNKIENNRSMISFLIEPGGSSLTARWERLLDGKQAPNWAKISPAVGVYKFLLSLTDSLPAVDSQLTTIYVN